MKKLACAITAVVLALAIPAMAADDKVSLTPKYLPGKYVLNMSMKSESAVVRGETEMPGSKVDMEVTMEMTVSSPDAKGDKEMAMQFTKFKQTMAVGAQGETSYSSTQLGDEGKEPWASVVKSLLAAKITATVSPDGSVSDIRGIEEAISNVAGDAGSSAVKNQMKSMFSEDNLKGMFDSGRKMLPKEPVAVGQSYKNTTPMNLPMLGAVDMAVEGKVVSINKTDNGSVATVDFQMKFDKKSLATEPGATTNPVMNNMKQFAVTMKGQMKFNVDLGMATEQKADQVMDMEMHAGDQTMKIKQTSTVTADVTFTPVK